MIGADVFCLKIPCVQCKTTVCGDNNLYQQEAEEQHEVEGEEFSLDDLIDEDYEENNGETLNMRQHANSQMRQNLEANFGYAQLKCKPTGKKDKKTGEKKVSWFYVCPKHNVKTRITTGTLFESSKIGIHQILQIFWCCLNGLTYTQARTQLKDEGMVALFLR